MASLDMSCRMPASLRSIGDTKSQPKEVKKDESGGGDGVPHEDAALIEAGGKRLGAGRNGIRIKGWIIESTRGSILRTEEVEEWGRLLQTTHLPEMVFGGSSLILTHESSGAVIHFNALDALHGWRKENLPPVQVPAATKWKQRTRPRQEIILGYDYTYTTPYVGSLRLDTAPQQQSLEVDVDVDVKTQVVPTLACSDEVEGRRVEMGEERVGAGGVGMGESMTIQVDRLVDARGGGDDKKDVLQAPSPRMQLEWKSCEERINVAILRARVPILFYDEVILYEDELADNGIALLTAKVRVMPACWFVLLRFWLRVDGVLMRIRDTRVFCAFDRCKMEDKEEGGGVDSSGSGRGEEAAMAQCVFPTVIREYNELEESFADLASQGFPADPIRYSDSNFAATVMSIRQHKCEKLCMSVAV